MRADSGLDPRAVMTDAGISVKEIPELKLASGQRLLDVHIERGQPARVTGAGAEWPEFAQWAPEALQRRMSDTQVKALIDLPAEGVLYPRDQSSYEKGMRFTDFIDHMLAAGADSPCYLAYQRAADLLPEGALELGSLLGGDSDDEPDTRLWIGSAGTRSLLHSDLKDNVFCQMWGHKIVTLLPSEQSLAAYPFPNNLVNSQLDIAHPDLDRFPRLAKASFLSSVVGPGDLVYIPKGCWHDIRSLSASVSINHWFGQPQPFGWYARLLLQLGPRYWHVTFRDFVLHGLLDRQEGVRFFFSPPSTGKRLYTAVRTRNFSADNDPAA